MTLRCVRRSSPPACAECNGAGKVVVLAGDFAELKEWERVWGGIGFWHMTCWLCRGIGSAQLDLHELGEYPPPAFAEE